MQPLDLTGNQSLEENAPALSGQGGSMEWKAAKDQNNSQDWRVEAIDFENEGEVNVAIFCGPNAKSLASEYAAWKNSAERKPMQKAAR